MKGYDTLFFLR